MSIAPLPANLPGNDSAADRLIAGKVGELITASNTAETKLTAHDAKLAALETRIAKLESPVVPPPPPPPPPPPVPVASVAVTVSPSAVEVGKTAQATATTKDLAGAVLTGRVVTFTISPSTVATVSASGLVTGIAAGTATITAISEGKSNVAQIAVTAAPIIVPPPPPPPGTVAELPRSEPVKVAPLGTGTGTVRRVAAGGDLQAALNTAVPGDVVLLAAGATFTGNYTLPQRKPGVGWITVRTEVATSTGRMTPTKAASLRLAKLVTPSSMPAIRCISLENPTAGWLLQDLEITGTLPIASLQYGLLWLGDSGWSQGPNETQTSLARVPKDFILQRLYVHGTDTLNSTRGIALNSAATSILDSWISGIHAIGTDSQAVCGWNGPGPYLLENSYIEGAGENFLFGGSDPAIDQLVPSDSTFRSCHFGKPLSWKGSQWQVKNLFELKSAQRVLIEGCVFDRCWPAAQEGISIVLKSTAAGGQLAFSGTRDVTFRNNIVDTAAVGIGLSAADNSYGWTGFTHMQRILIEHNLFTRIGPDGRSALIMLTQDLKDIVIRRNTFVHNAGARGLPVVMADSGGAARRIALTDNIMTAPAGYIATYPGLNHSAAITAFANDGSFTTTGNVFPGFDPQYSGLNPTGNVYNAPLTAVNVDGSLPAGSPYTGKGADVAEVLRRTSGAVVAP